MLAMLKLKLLNLHALGVCVDIAHAVDIGDVEVVLVIFWYCFWMSFCNFLWCCVVVVSLLLPLLLCFVCVFVFVLSFSFWCFRWSFGCAVCSGLLQVLCGEIVLSTVGCCWLLLISAACLFSVLCLCFLLGAFDGLFALLLAMH